MDLSKGKKEDSFWKYMLGIGAGLGFGYLAYKALFPKYKLNESIDSLSRNEAEERSLILKDIKYNLYLKMRFNLEEANQPLQHHRAAIKGVLVLEFDLLKIKNLTMEFGGYILEFTNLSTNQKVKYSHDQESKKVLIDYSNLIRGKNKFIIYFSVKEFHKGIIYNDQIYFTDFQPFGAHNLFPCFDQPDLKSTINLFLALPKSMQAFSVSDYSLIDNSSYDNPELRENILSKGLEIINKDEFNFLSFTTTSLPLYSFFFCAGDLKAQEYDSINKKISQRIIVPCSRNDISVETKKNVFEFTDLFSQYFKQTFQVDFFPCPYINHIFLPHGVEMKEKSLDNFCNIIYPDDFIDKIKNTNDYLFFLTLIGKSLINQFYGHNISLIWWDDFWFKESLSIFLAYELNYKLSQFELKSKKELINTFKELDYLKDIWCLFIRFNSKAYTYDRDNRKNHPIIKDIESAEEIYKIKDEMTYCKGPAIIKYLCYLVGNEVFYDMVKKFILTFKDTHATYADFLKMLERSADKKEIQELQYKVDNVNEELLKRTCPPVFSYEIKINDNKLKNFSITEEQIEGLNNPASMIETDILFVALNPSANHHGIFMNTQKFDNINITCEDSINDKLLTTVKFKPEFVLLNYTDNSYLIQKFTDEQCEWLTYNINFFKDPIILSVIIRNLTLMTYNNLFSPRKLIKILLELLLTNSNIFNIDYFLKNIIFLINEFIPNNLHQSEYKLKLFETIADTLAKTDSLNSLYNVFIRVLIDCTDGNNKEELVKLIEYIASSQIQYRPTFSKRSSGIINMDFNDFKVNDLLKLPENLSDKMTKENLKRLLLLILKSEVIQQECISISDSGKIKSDTKTPLSEIKTLENLKDVLISKFYKDYCSDEIKAKTDTILYPSEAWKKIVIISNSKSYFPVNNWILETLLTPQLLRKLGVHNLDAFKQIIQNALASENLNFLERFFRYSADAFPSNEEMKKLYYQFSKLLEGYRYGKNEKQVEKIMNLIVWAYNRIVKKMDIIEKYEALWSGKEENINNSLDNSKTYAN